jgi:hypothetical protein
MKRSEVGRLIARSEVRPRFQLRLPSLESERATGDLGMRARISVRRRNKKITLPTLTFLNEDT